MNRNAETAGMRIDVHNHIYPKVHLDAVAKFGSSSGWRIVNDERMGNDMLYGDRGYPFPLSRSCSDPEFRIKELDRAQITMQLQSPSEPWFDFLPTDESVRVVRAFNNETARIAEKYPQRFAGLAGLPLNDVGAAIQEARRATRDLGLKGAIIPTRVQGERSIASQEFVELFQEFDRLRLPVFIHPTLPPGAERYRKYFLGMAILYPQETSLTIAELMFNGHLEKFDQVKIMVADLGGGLPLLAGRMHRFYEAIGEARQNLKKPPLEYLKQIYFENGSEFFQHAMKCCYVMAGPDKMLLGTNHPSPIVAFEDATKSIEDMDIPEVEKDKIRYLNAKNLFNLEL